MGNAVPAGGKDLFPGNQMRLIIRDADSGDRLRDMADRNNVSPSELAEIIRGGSGN